MSSIFYNNKDSFKEFGLKIENMPIFPSTNKKFESVPIPGSEHGGLNIFDGFEDLNIQFNFVFKAREDFIFKKSNILAWLNEEYSKELRYSLYDEVYYLVKKVSLSDFKTTTKIVRRFTATFTIDPFAYLIEGKKVKTLKTPNVMFNHKANHNSPLYIKVYGSGDIAININNQKLVLRGVDGYIEVDSILKNCFKNINGKIVNENDKMYSPFPSLEVGKNNISWNGNVSKLEIIPRWCCK